MRARLLLVAVSAAGAIGLGGCGSKNLCDRNENFRPSTKVGDCPVQQPEHLFGTRNECSRVLSSCSESDQAVLDDVLTCWQNLPVCKQADQEKWQSQTANCAVKLLVVSNRCWNSLLLEEVEPVMDAGEGEPDAGADAGIQPDTTDAGALDLIAVSDNERIALAWTASQDGWVLKWQVNGFNAADVPTDPVLLPASKMSYTASVGPGTKMKYFVAGLDLLGRVVQGFPDAGMGDGGMSGDAGTGCSSNFQCPTNEICNISSGACEALPCNDSNVCPAGYLCDTQVDHVCERQTITPDGGIDAGTGEEQVGEVPKPFVSELVEVTTAPAEFSSDRFISVFDARNIDGVAIDSARQFAVMEQAGQLYGYYTQNRGASFRAQLLDPSGSRPKAAYEPQSRTVFLCYNAFGGIRVRASSDFGRTFPGAVDIKNEESLDGGIPVPIQDCDIAPWQDGTALVTAVEGDAVKLWTVSKDLEIIGAATTVFTSTSQVFSPTRPAIATLPSDFMVHILFGASRVTTGGVTDSEVKGMYRDTSTGGTFVGPLNVHNPNVFEQRDPDVVIDPVTKRAVAAFVSRESTDNRAPKDTVYVSYWDATRKIWLYGPDLNLFVMDNQSTRYLVMPERKLGETWLARSPSVTVTPTGKVYVSFMAGNENASQPNLFPWVVEFDFKAPSPRGGTVPGWFSPPAARVSSTHVASVSGNDHFGPIVVSDSQISHYVFFVEGVGTGGALPNRPVMVTRPK